MNDTANTSASIVVSDTEKKTWSIPKIPNWLKTSVAILVSIVFLYYYFRNMNWQEVYASLQDANLTLAVFSLLVTQVIYWFFDTYQRERHFSWFNGPFPWKDYFFVRGALYLVMMFNGAVGSVGLMVYLKKRTDITWMKLFGITTFRFLMHLAGWVLTLIGLTVAMIMTDAFDKLPIPVYPYVYIWLAILCTGPLLLLDGWLFFFHDKKIGVWQFIIRDKQHEFWRPLDIASRTQWVLTMIWGVVPVVILCSGYWFFAYAFGVKIPVLYFTVTIILVIIIADMPLAFAGLGTTTLAWVLFYGDYANEAVMASLTLSLPILRILIRSAIGLICLKPAIGDIQEMFKATEDNEMPERPNFPFGKDEPEKLETENLETENLETESHNLVSTKI